MAHAYREEGPRAGFAQFPKFVFNTEKVGHAGGDDLDLLGFTLTAAHVIFLHRHLLMISVKKGGFPHFCISTLHSPNAIPNEKLLYVQSVTAVGVSGFLLSSSTFPRPQKGCRAERLWLAHTRPEGPGLSAQ